MRAWVWSEEAGDDGLIRFAQPSSKQAEVRQGRAAHGQGQSVDRVPRQHGVEFGAGLGELVGAKQGADMSDILNALGIKEPAFALAASAACRSPAAICKSDSRRQAAG